MHIFLCALMVLLLSPVLEAKTKPLTMLDGIVATVNNRVITESELSEKAQEVSQQIQQQHMRVPPLNVLKKHVLDRAIGELLQLELAEGLGIQVEDHEIQDTIVRLAERNHLSPKDFISKVTQGGVSEAAFRDRIRQQMIFERLIQSEVKDHLSVDPQEVQRLSKVLQKRKPAVEAVRLRHLWLPVAESASSQTWQQARTEILKIRASIHSEDDFRAQVALYSRDPDAREGGDWGWRRLQELPERFSEAVRALKPGSVSAPIRTGNGFHLLFLSEAKSQEGEDLSQTAYHVKHILLRRALHRDPEKLKSLARNLRQQLHKHNFSEMARRYSEDHESQLKGGDLGWVAASDLPPALARALKSSSKGSLVGPVEASYGIHLAMVLGRKQMEITSADWEALARRILEQRAMAGAVERWLLRLREQASVHIDPRYA